MVEDHPVASHASTASTIPEDLVRDCITLLESVQETHRQFRQRLRALRTSFTEVAEPTE